MSHNNFVYYEEAAAEHDKVSSPPDFWSVSSQVAYHRYEDVIYSAVTQFVRENSDIQYMFALAKHDDREGTDFIVNSIEACSIIPNVYRQSVLSVFERNTAILLASYAPSSFAMTTAMPNLQRRQLKKYDCILKVFRNFGYTMESCEADSEGHLTWQLALAK